MSQALAKVSLEIPIQVQSAPSRPRPPLLSPGVQKRGCGRAGLTPAAATHPLPTRKGWDWGRGPLSRCSSALSRAPQGTRLREPAVRVLLEVPQAEGIPQANAGGTHGSGEVKLGLHRRISRGLELFWDGAAVSRPPPLCSWLWSLLFVIKLYFFLEQFKICSKMETVVQSSHLPPTPFS